MIQKLNPHVSVDCVVFGYHNGQLKVLLIEREPVPGNTFSGHKLKLPGSLISETEDLDVAAIHTLRDLTGIENIFLKQFAVFGSPQRLLPEEDLEWLRATSKMGVDRVVTIAYFSLIKISDSNMTDRTIWHPVHQLPELIFDHNSIVNHALAYLRREFRTEPLAFELLPKKFTLRQMQSLYEAVLLENLDSRNFRKKIKPLAFLTALSEKEEGVNHKPAQLYRFDRKLYTKLRKQQSGFNL